MKMNDHDYSSGSVSESEFSRYTVGFRLISFNFSTFISKGSEVQSNQSVNVRFGSRTSSTIKQFVRSAH
jgi:hypothetical protein